MSTLISLEKIYLAFGGDPILDHVDLQIAVGERVCLIGRNGAGKSSLLKIIEGVIQPDQGKIHRDPHLKIACLMQELPQNVDLTVYDFVAEGLAHVGKLLSEYHQLIQHLTDSPADLQRMEYLQHAIDDCDGWQFEQSMQTILDRLALSGDLLVSALSGGWQRRAALARALVVKPDLLLLDEPTNHLDIEAIQWLEEQLLDYYCGGILFITHDRALLKRLATRIIELDRGKLSSWPGDYTNFLRRKEEALSAEAKLNSEFDKKLAAEERWIRQGVKARRTRNEGRVRALEAMRREHQKRRYIQGTVNFEVSGAEQSGQLVIVADHIQQSYDSKIIIKDFSTRIMRGDRIGLLGPNGIGKTTLLNILLGKIKPDSGKITHGTKLQIAYFDQLRAKLDLEKTVLDNVAEGRTSMTINGKEKHVISYLNDFLFTPDRIRIPVKALSGGECNRLLLARLFSLPANVLVLDEPTNDLDVETLELLEELLTEFTGTLLLVSHDRAFIDNIVTSTLVFEGDGVVQEYIGGYEDWLRQRPKSFTSSVSTEKNIPSTKKEKLEKAKLSFNEQRELSELPKKIEALEQRQQILVEEIAKSEFYQQESAIIQKVLAEFKEIEADLKAAYQRWEVLDQ